LPVDNQKEKLAMTNSESYKKCLSLFVDILHYKEKTDARCVHISKVNQNIHGSTKDVKSVKK